MAPSRSGAGGKIVTNRRKQRLSATPYDRPPPLRSPNWFTGVVVPSARAFASGAGKILSSIFADESESSSSSEEEDSASDDDIDHDNQSEIPSNGVNTLNEYGLEPQSSVWRSETKQIIEQLIMQETFSRDECGKLIEVLNSRVIDWSMEAREKSALAGSPGKTFGNEDVVIYDKAVQEAKKWFQEKKVGSSSVTGPAYGTCNLNSTRLEHVESEGGSPINVARSYMKEKPPWASPTRNVELRTPLTTMKLFKDGTSYSVGSNSLSSSKKRSSLASGSWNIHEELRKVRSKATYEMLHTLSTKTDRSMFTAPIRVEPLGASGPVFDKGGRMTVAESLRETEPIDALVDAGVSSDPALAALKSMQVGKAGETESSEPVTSAAGNEVSEVAQADGEYGAIKFRQSSIPNYTEERHIDPDLSKTNGAGTTVSEFSRKQSVNGLSASQASVSAEVSMRQNQEQIDVANHNTDTVNEKQPVNTIDIEGNYELLSEASMEVPILTETGNLPSGSQNSLGVQNEEPSLDMTQPKEKQGKKSGKYKGRSRGRGK